MIKIDWLEFVKHEGIFGYHLWCDRYFTDMDDGQEDAWVEEWYIDRPGLAGYTKVWHKSNGTWKRLYRNGYFDD